MRFVLRVLLSAAWVSCIAGLMLIDWLDYDHMRSGL